MGVFRMPSLGADMEHGTVLEWRVHPGDVVHRGDIVAVVDTDKADIEVEVFEEGTVDEVLVEVGRQVPVGTPLATIAPLGASTSAPDAGTVAVPEPAPVLAPGLASAPEPARARVAPAAAKGWVRASPYARRRSADLGIELASLHGSGPGGAVVARDVAAPPLPATAPARAASRRANVAALMARSKREVPHYYLGSVVDLGPAMAWLADENAGRPARTRLLPASVLLAAVARAAAEVETMNGHWIDDAFRPSSTIDLGVAIAVRDEGLVAPVIADAAKLTVDEMMERLRELTGRARRRSFRGSDLAPPSITVTSLGDQGADAVYGVIYPPQVALVGAGRVVDRVLAVEGQPAVRPSITLTLAADHRASDGHDGSRFLAAVVDALGRPAALNR